MMARVVEGNDIAQNVAIWDYFFPLGWKRAPFLPHMIDKIQDKNKKIKSLNKRYVRTISQSSIIYFFDSHACKNN